MLHLEFEGRVKKKPMIETYAKRAQTGEKEEVMFAWEEQDKGRKILEGETVREAGHFVVDIRIDMKSMTFWWPFWEMKDVIEGTYS